MLNSDWLRGNSPAFRLMIATSWLSPDSWREIQESAIRKAIEFGPNWEEYVRLVDRHRTPALSWAALNRSHKASIPEPIQHKLQQRSDACRMEAVSQCLLLATALKAFNRAEIPVMPFKGRLLSLDLYNDIGLRQSRDLDLAVRAGDLFKAKECLESMGWTLEPSIWFPLTPRQWASVLQHEHHLEFVHTQTGCQMELHWRDQWESEDVTRARWDRSIPSVWQGCSIRLMSPLDLTLYLCSHGGSHMWFRAKWLGDLARAHATGQLDWKAAFDMASRIDQRAALQLSLCLLNQLYELPLPDLAQDPLKTLKPPLVKASFAALADAKEPISSDSVGWFLHLLRTHRYERLLQPRTRWRDSISQFLYGREDFRTLPLPDSLFMAYAPLHPFLWAWRRVWRLFPPHGSQL